MPRTLIAHGCTLHQVDITSMKVGDLLFLKKTSNNQMEWKNRYLVHVMLVVNTGLTFHSSEIRKGGSTENLLQPTDDYAKKLPQRVINEPYHFLRYLDPRNIKTRDLYGSELIPFRLHRPLSDEKLLIIKWIWSSPFQKKVKILIIHYWND